MSEKVESFPKRLAKLMEVSGYGTNSSEFAKACDIKPTTFYTYEDRSLPGMLALEKISKATNVSLDWLITGQGEMMLNAVKQNYVASTRLQGFIPIPRIDVQASAGYGNLATHEETIGMLSFRETWLAGRGINPHTAKVISAKGDSMEPTIRDGDILLIDGSVNHVADHGIYIVIVSGMVLVKRIQISSDQSIVLKSDNGMYNDESFDASRKHELEIAGRVMWFGRNI